MTVTRNVLVRAMPFAQRHALKVTNPLLCDDDDDDDSDEIDMQVAYTRPRLHKSKINVDTDHSEYVKIRLMIARMRAMEVHKKTWT